MSVEPEIAPLTHLTRGQLIPFGGDRVVSVDGALAEAFRSGDHLVVVQSTGSLLHIPRAVHDAVTAAVGEAAEGFAALAACDDDAISDFFDRFAGALGDDEVFAPIAEANARDVADAADRGRSTTRLALDARMRADMIAGLLEWRDSTSRRDGVISRVAHDQWSVELNRAPLGVVGFVFEGRPNVFADACGVVRTGNAVVFRIGSDALGTARAIVEHALLPSVVAAGLPSGIVRLIDSPTHASAHALFNDQRLALAVARGSGPVVAELGAVAAQVGTPVSLHGTGGAWMVVAESASPEAVTAAVRHSLDRKVCNTLNVCAVVRARAETLVPAFVAGLDAAAAQRDAAARLHVVEGSEAFLPIGVVSSTVRESDLATEWEWEDAAEVTLVVVDSIDQAVGLCNHYSARFVASLISEDPEDHRRFYDSVEAPFVGTGFTRWVDGQYALNAPELGLSNWQHGRTLGRGAILSGDSVFTVRYRAMVDDSGVHR